MLEISHETIVSLAPAVLLSFLIYLFIFIKRNSLSKILEGVAYFLYLLVIILFLVVGYGIANLLIEQKQYIGLIIPLGWFYICYQGIKQLLFVTFGISVRKLIDFDSFIGLNPKVLSNLAKIVFFALMSLGFLFSTVMIFFVAVPDTANQPYGTFPLIIAGLIFLVATVILFYVLYKIISEIIFHRASLIIKDKTMVVKQGANIGKIFFRIWLLFAFLFVVLFIYLAIVGKPNG